MILFDVETSDRNVDLLEYQQYSKVLSLSKEYDDIIWLRYGYTYSKDICIT